MEPAPPTATPPPEPLGRGATIGAFAAVVVAGLLGGTIGAGLVNVSSDDAGAWIILGAVIGAAIGAGGVAIVAIVMLRAMQEWESHQRQAPPSEPGDGPDPEHHDIPSDGTVV